MLSLLFLAALASGDQNPVSPQDTQQAVYEVSEESVRLFDDALDKLYRKNYAEALATASRIKVERENKIGRSSVAAVRGAALLGLKRNEDAAKLFADANALAPGESYPSVLQFEIGLHTDQFEVAAAGLDSLIARFPDTTRDLKMSAISYFLRNEPKGEEQRNDDRRVALARLGYGAESEDGDYIISLAVKILTKRGDIVGAVELLPKLDSPSIIENLLIQKRYSALWPRLEQLAGPHMEKVRASAAASAEQAYAKAPDVGEKLQFLVNAYRNAGRLDDAIALGAKLPITSEGIVLADEQMGWAVNNVALAMYDAGRAEEADRLFALLNEAPMAKEGWRVSMKINRLELLVRDGKFDKALPLIEPTAQAKGSPYAAQLVRRLRLCTLSGLGRKEEAAKLLPELHKYAEDALGSTIEGLMCAGDIDAAEKLALSSLKKDSFHESFLRSLQSHTLTSDDPSVWDAGWKKLRQRPAIDMEFQRLGRELPSALLPRPVKAR